MYPKHLACAVHPILLVSKQLHSEATDALSHLPANYVLDVVLYKELYLIPTWLVMPHPQGSVPSCIDSVTCNFRIAGCYDKRISGYSDFSGGCQAGAAMSWVLYSLMERFFYCGPHWHDPKPQEMTDFVIKMLRIDVQTPPGIPSAQFIDRPRSQSRRTCPPPIDELSPPILSPNYFFNFIKRYIFSLLKMGYHTAEYGDILYSHLDFVKLTLDGKTETTIDIGDSLEKLNNQRFETTPWKQMAMALRKRRGLRWVEFPSWDGSDLAYRRYGAFFLESDCRV